MPINKKYLFGSIGMVLALCVAQVLGSTPLILLCLAAFLVLVGWSCSKNYTLPILLFFLPWSPILRTSPTGYSFFTFALVLVCGISVLKKRFRFPKYPLVAGILLLFLTLLSKVIDGQSLAFSYIAFMMLIVIFPIVKGEWPVRKYDFFHIAVFFSLGVAIAALCALFLDVFPNIAKYIRVDTYSTIIRRCGFYGDPNFYTAQITAAMGGCLLLILREKKVGHTALLGILVVVLVYCGFLSGSKSFVLISACEFGIWLIALLRLQGRKGLKIGALIAVAVLAVTVASSTLFTNLIDVVITRFSSSKDISSFTTGRTELWISYLEEILGNAKIFFLGKGFTNVKVAGKASHNTLLQCVFQFGFFGVPILTYWVISFFRGTSLRRLSRRGTVLESLMVIIGAFLPWMAIDALFFDEFFLLQWYVFSALQQLQYQDET